MKANDVLDALSPVLISGYDTLDRIKKYVLERIEQERYGNVSVGRLAEICYLEDCSGDVDPVKYLKNIFCGKTSMTGQVLDRLCCALNMKADEPFPFVSAIDDDVTYDVNKRLTGVDVREECEKKGYQVGCLGLGRVMALRKVLGWD